jgi:hypothetical protein
MKASPLLGLKDEAVISTKRLAALPNIVKKVLFEIQ